jgi:hypothetical protein
LQTNGFQPDSADLETAYPGGVGARVTNLTG